MEEKKKKTMRQMYDTACNNYLEAFAEKHGFDGADCSWVGNEPGGIAIVGDFYVGMQTLTDDINMDAPEEEFIRWYDYLTECSDLGLDDKCNFRSWLKGCPRYSDETILRLTELKRKAREAEELLRTSVEEERKKMQY